MAEETIQTGNGEGEASLPSPAETSASATTEGEGFAGTEKVMLAAEDVVAEVTAEPFALEPRPISAPPPEAKRPSAAK
jgi:hypothetical protein